jgi:hypothetical protein
MNNNIEANLPILLDTAKQIQQGRMIERTEAENLLLQTSIVKTFFLNKRKKIERQFNRKLGLVDAKIQLIDSARRLFINCTKLH